MNSNNSPPFLLQESQDEIRSILLRNAAFFCYGEEDTNLYYTGLEPIAILAYHVLQYIGAFFTASIPILKGGIWIRERLGRKSEDLSAETDEDAERASAAKLDDSLNRLKAQSLEIQKKIEELEQRRSLVLNVTEILAYHGWPDDEAGADAQRIVDAVAAVLTRRKP